MALLTLQNISPNGLNPTFTAVNSEDTVVIGTGQRVFLHVKNASGNSRNVTFTARTTSAVVSGVGNVTIGNLVVSVPANQERIIGPITEAYMDTDGTVTISYQGTASITAAAFQLPAQY